MSDIDINKVIDKILLLLDHLKSFYSKIAHSHHTEVVWDVSIEFA